MVGEGQVAAATLDVELHPQSVAGDRRALDVPPGSARPPGGGPRRLAGTIDAPQQRIQRVFLAGSVGVATALGEGGGHLVVVVARLVPELLGRAVAVVDVGVAVDGGVDAVGVTTLEELGHHLHDLVDGLGGRDVVTRREDPERLHVLAEPVGLAVPQLLPVDAVTLGPLEQRVVDIGGVLDVVDLVPGVEQLTVDEVEREIGGRVTEMGGVVRGDPADVHACDGPRRHLAGLPAGRVEQPQGGAVAGDRGDDRRGPRVHAAESRDHAVRRAARVRGSRGRERGTPGSRGGCRRAR